MAQLALSKGQPWNNPQPTPQQFGYLVEGQAPAPKPDALTSFIQTISAQPQAQAPSSGSDIGAVQPGNS